MSTDDIKSGLDLNKPGPTLIVLWGISPAILMLLGGVVSMLVAGFLPMMVPMLLTPIILFPWSLKLVRNVSVSYVGKIFLALLFTIAFSFLNVMLAVGGCAFVVFTMDAASQVV